MNKQLTEAETQMANKYILSYPISFVITSYLIAKIKKPENIKCLYHRYGPMRIIILY